MTATLPARPKAGVRVLRAIVLAALAAAATVAGVWIAGGVITNDFRLSMALTALWFALAAAASLASFKAGRSIGIPLLAGYLIAAIVTGGYLAATTLRDRVVDETVVTGTPASAMPAAPADPEDLAEPKPEPVNVEESRGTFTAGEHATTGIARTVRLARDGRRVLTLTGFETAAGPDLRVRVVPGDGTDGNAGGAIDLGALKGNRGDQQYDLPDGLRPGRHTVLIWCRAFSALFGSARLKAS
jgi:Electron transfer DM13